MEHFVSLDRVPPGLQVPAELHDRFHYDHASRRLIHRGFMSKADFDRLWLISEDWGYRRALEELFRECTPDETARPRGFKRWLAPFLGGSASARA